MKTVVLSRDRTVGFWKMTSQNGSTVTLTYTAAKKAGYVAAEIARLNPDTQIGIRSEDIGPHMMSYGPVCWLKPGFERG